MAKRYGAETMAEIEWTAWNDQIVPELERMKNEFLPAGTVYDDPNQRVRDEDRRRDPRRLHRTVHAAARTPVDLSKEQLVTWFLGSHEYLLQCIEAWAAQIVVRYWLDEMFDIQWTLWGDSVLPGVKKLKAEYLGITGNTVEDWMKDLQIDATALPGKAFDLSFEMPEPDVGIMTFNRCVAVDQWEAMGRPDILEKNCHSTCPKSMIVTTEMYNPNMKVDILAIPPRVDPGDVCCKWRFSMRDRGRSRVRARRADEEAGVAGLSMPVRRQVDQSHLARNGHERVAGREAWRRTPNHVFERAAPRSLSNAYVPAETSWSTQTS